MSDERRAFVCFTKEGQIHKRVFLRPDEPEPPKCEVHGKMQRQGNKPYMKGRQR